MERDPAGAGTVLWALRGELLGLPFTPAQNKAASCQKLGISTVSWETQESRPDPPTPSDPGVRGPNTLLPKDPGALVCITLLPKDPGVWAAAP